jgi:hypothetical protein
MKISDKEWGKTTVEDKEIDRGQDRQIEADRLTKAKDKTWDTRQRHKAKAIRERRK